MSRIVIGFAIVGLAVGGAGCSERPPSTSAPAAQASGPAWMLASEPDGAVGVVEAKARAQEGDAVVIRGRIGGRAAPITPGSPVFTIIDLSLSYCGQASDDGCTTPWDYCCEAPDAIVAHGATVQVADVGDGDLAGLSPLDEVVVVGTVGPRPTETVLTIVASGVHRVGG